MLPTGRRSRYIYHVLSLMTIVYCLDHILPRSLPPPIAVGERNDGGNKIVVVTGANAGIGYETSRRLALDYGTTVIMGCRSKSRCDVASSAIRDELMKRGGEERGGGGTGDVIPMNIDLSDFDSVRSLASELRARRIVVDVLFNNAGYVPLSGTKVDENTGLETSFMSMHLGHFYLTELLLMDNPKLRIVNTSSGTHHICALLNFSYTVHSSMTKLITRWTHGGVDGDNDGVSSHGGGSCINDDFLIRGMHSNTDGNAYIRAKLANVMHVVELPRRHPTATAMVVDLGWVGTSIQPFMRGSVIVSATFVSLLFLPLLVGGIGSWVEDVKIGGRYLHVFYSNFPSYSTSPIFSLSSIPNQNVRFGGCLLSRHPSPTSKLDPRESRHDAKRAHRHPSRPDRHIVERIGIIQKLGRR